MSLSSFWEHAYRTKSPCAHKWFKIGTVGQVVLLLGGHFIQSGFRSYGSWTNRDLAVVGSLILLIVVARLMHADDARSDGYGVKSVYKKFNARHRLDDNVVSGVLSRESIQGAITLVVLAALIGSERAKPPAGLSQIISEPNVLIFWTVAFVLGLSVITTLAGTLCYDYSSRFEWPDEVRDAFISKGHKVGRFGFYSLMWSLAAITALLNYFLCMFAILLIYWTMWWYYFFPVKKIMAALSKKQLPDLGNVNLQTKVLDNIRLEFVNLAGANLKSASLKGASLKGSRLTGVILEGADLTGAELTQGQIDSAKGDKQTILPAGLCRPLDWNK